MELPTQTFQIIIAASSLLPVEALQYHNRIMGVITKLAHSISTRNKGKGMRNANFKLETKLYVFSGPIIHCPTDPALPEEQLWSV